MGGCSVAGGRSNRYPGYPRPLPEAGVAIDAIADMHDKLRGGTGDAFAMGHVIERPLQFRMFLDVAVDFLERLAGGLEAVLEFGFRLDLGFAERHLHAAVGVDFAFARSFDRQEDHVLEFVDY